MLPIYGSVYYVGEVILTTLEGQKWDKVISPSQSTLPVSILYYERVCKMIKGAALGYAQEIIQY